MPKPSALFTALLLAAVALGDEKGPGIQLSQTLPLPGLTGGTNHLAADAKRGRFFVT
jgi:hypothetical protein